MTWGMVTPATNMCAAASSATASGHRRRPSSSTAPVETASHCAQTGASVCSNPPALRTSSRASSPTASTEAARTTSWRPTAGRGRSHSSSTPNQSRRRWRELGMGRG